MDYQNELYENKLPIVIKPLVLKNIYDCNF